MSRADADEMILNQPNRWITLNHLYFPSMSRLRLPLWLSISCFLVVLCQAATKEQWRSRSIYQLLTDRFAPPSGTRPACDPSAQRYCGGTHATIIDKLDYIKGIDSIWISPVGLNLENTGGKGEAYHGYWSTDPTRLNPHFGDENSLLALSAAVHSRGMYLMVDVALNHLASRSSSITQAQLTADEGPLLFRNTANFHAPCDIAWGDRTSERLCWLYSDAANGIPLMDVATETSAVRQVLYNWAPTFVKKFGIDGLRIDAARNMDQEFVRGFCAASGVFCTGEVSDSDAAYLATYQSAGIDSVLSFPVLFGIQGSFTGASSTRDINKVAFSMFQTQSSFSDPSVLGTFTENHDQPRLWSLTNDASLTFNGLVTTFQFEGIPILYYGFEQDVGSDGASDPHNREALWLYTNYSTTATPTYARISKLNKLRKYLASNSNFLTSQSSRVQQQAQDLAMVRAGTLTILTNRGSSSGTASWTITSPGFAANAVVTEIFTCTTSVVASSGSLTVSIKNGLPMIFVPQAQASAAEVC
ncbi:putative alpha-amylase AmyA [Mycena crocata]|nr:putative alpha-amylase AmyA [Mycena crocata]